MTFSRLDYQPLFGKMNPHSSSRKSLSSGRIKDRTRETVKIEPRHFQKNRKLMTLRDFSRGNESSNRYCYKDMKGVVDTIMQIVLKVLSSMFRSLLCTRITFTHLENKYNIRLWNELNFLWNELTILWNELTILWNDLTINWNDLTMERNDRIPGKHPGYRSHGRKS